MDSFELSELINDKGNRQFWLKPFGIPGAPVGDYPDAAQESLRTDFSKIPSAIKPGDILLVYRIGVSRLTYIAEVLSEAQEATPSEIEHEAWRDRWRWGVPVRNVTPMFGADWKQYSLAPFALAQEYNLLHPDDEQKLGPVQHGNDKLKISKGFASFIFRRIIDL